MRISDWSSDVCSSDLRHCSLAERMHEKRREVAYLLKRLSQLVGVRPVAGDERVVPLRGYAIMFLLLGGPQSAGRYVKRHSVRQGRTEEHTSELQSLLRI